MGGLAFYQVLGVEQGVHWRVLSVWTNDPVLRTASGLVEPRRGLRFFDVVPGRQQFGVVDDVLAIGFERAIRWKRTCRERDSVWR